MIGRAPAFWSRPASLAGLLLAPIGCVVGALTLRRMARPSQSVPVPVICIGNPTVGGAGKTPTALALLARLSLQAHVPFALLRGHGGSLAGPVRVVPAVHDAAAVGDEALLLAAAAPTVVSRDRPAGARLAVAEGASVILMDDGFQNPSLTKDVSILVIDGSAGAGNGRVLPAGPLRAPLAPQIAAADAVLIVGGGPAGDEVADVAGRQGKPVLRGAIRPDPQVIAALRGHRVLAFAGIGRPDKLAATLRAAGVEVAGLRAFPDHHPYGSDEIAALAAEAERTGTVLVTTSKDMARLQGPAYAGLRPAITVLPIAMEIGPQAIMDDLLALAFARAAPRLLQAG